MTPREAFKVGFLARCVEDGCDSAAIQQRAKQAADKLAGVEAIVRGLAKLPGQAASLAKPVVSAIAGYGPPALLAAPIAAGGILGYAGGKLTDIDDTDVAEVKQREVIDELRRQTQRLRQLQASRQRRAASGRPVRRFA